MDLFVYLFLVEGQCRGWVKISLVGARVILIEGRIWNVESSLRPVALCGVNEVPPCLVGGDFPLTPTHTPTGMQK